LDIVLLDATAPFGYGHVFPRGALREPISGLRRADVVALTRSEHATAEQRASIRSVVSHWAPKAAWLVTTHAPRALRSSDGGEAPIETLRGRRIAAFCGIGAPHAFRHTLEQCGATVVEFREFPDHHPYHRD